MYVNEWPVALEALIESKKASYSPTAKYLHSNKFYLAILCYF